MLDIVFPQNNEKALAEMALFLGYDELWFVYDEKQLPKQKFDFKIKTKIAVVNPKNPAKAGRNAYILLADKDARHYLEKTAVDIVFGLESKADKDYMKQRNSGLNQVLCTIAAKRSKIYGFNFRDVLFAKNRPDVIGRMMQNIMLCRKYKVKTIFFSGAQEPLEMRNHKDLSSFFDLLGRK